MSTTQLAHDAAILKRQWLDDKQVYTVEELADLTAFDTATIRRACGAGRIAAHKGKDGRWRITGEALRALQTKGLPPVT